MAAFDADILLDLITGPAERQVKKIESKIDRLDRKAGDIDVRFDIDDREIRRADRLLDNLSRNRTVKLRIDEQVRRSGGSGGSGGGGSTLAGLLPAAASAGAIAALPKALGQATQNTEQLKRALDESGDALNEIVALSQRSALNADSLSIAYDKAANAQDRFRDQQNKITQKQGTIAQRSAGVIGGRSVKQLKGDLDTLNNKAARLETEVNGAVGEFTRVQSITEQVEDNLDGAIERQRKLNAAARQFVDGGGGGGRALPPGGGGRGGRRGGGIGAAAAGGALGGLRGNIATTIASLVGLNEAIQETGRIISATLDRTSSNQRLQALSNGFDSYASTLDVATRAAQRFNLSQTDAQQQIAQVYGRLRPLGLTLQEIESVYSGFNTAARLSGASAAESAGAFLQLSQALGAGALRGEEFNSVAEQAPGVLTAIARVMDEPVGALKDLAKEGRITRDIVLQALQDIEKQGAARLADVLDTPASKLAKLNARLDDLRVELGELSLPAYIGLLERVTAGIEKIIGKVETWRLGLQNINRTLTSIENRIPNFVKRFADGIATISQNLVPLFLLLKGIDNLMGRAAQAERDILGPPPTEYDKTQGADLNMDAIRQMSQQIAQQQQGIVDSSSATSTNFDSAADTLARQMEAGKELSKEFTRQLNLLSATSDLERELLQIRFDHEDRAVAIAGALADQRAELQLMSDIIKGAEIGTAIGQVLAEDVIDASDKLNDAFADAQDRFNDFYREATEKTKFDELLEQTGQRVASALTDSIGTAIDGLIRGADDLNQKLQEIASTLLRDLGSLFLRAGINAAAGPGGFFGPQGLPGFAAGGVIPMGTTAVVGEDGPEIVHTRPNGTTVIPNNPFADAAAAMSESSATATSKAYADSADAMEMATATMTSNFAAAQERKDMAEAAAQMNSTSSILVETTLVDEIEVVSLEQLNRATQASAKQAEANVMRGLRNRPAVRSKAGVR